jgi:hypothetical protein
MFITFQRVGTILNLVPHIHLRLMSAIYVPSVTSSNIWRYTINNNDDLISRVVSHCLFDERFSI